MACEANGHTILRVYTFHSLVLDRYGEKIPWAPQHYLPTTSNVSDVLIALPTVP